uniref:Uncharacterized protein n=1 Tax=Globodera rostochiensis TaxID=31243 RepID=A0A914HZK9_GLORO
MLGISGEPLDLHDKLCPTEKAESAEKKRNFWRRFCKCTILLPLFLFLLFGGQLLLLSLEMNAKFEQQTKILNKLVEAQNKSRRMIAISAKEFEAILNAAIATKLENVPKARLLDDGKRPIIKGGPVGEIGGAIDKANVAKNWPSNETFSPNSTTESDGHFLLNCGGLWRFVHFQKGATAALATVIFFALATVIFFALSTVIFFALSTVIFFALSTVTFWQRLAPFNWTMEATVAGDGAQSVVTDAGDAMANCESGPPEKEEAIPLEASVWWQYFSAPINEKTENSAENVASIIHPKPSSILKKRPSKKPFEAAEGHNANASPKMGRLVIPRRPNKDVRFVAKNETPPSELTNNLTRPRFSPKEIQMEASNENSRLIFFFGAEEQFGESLEEKMARRIGDNWKCYSKRGSGDRRKAKWLRLLEAFEHRRKKKSEALKSLHL